VNFYHTRSQSPPNRVNRLTLEPVTSPEEIWLTDFVAHFQDKNVKSLHVQLHDTSEEMTMDFHNIRSGEDAA